MTNIAMENCPFIDGLPVYLLKMVIFHGYVSHNQMVIRVGINVDVAPGSQIEIP